MSSDVYFYTIGGDFWGRFHRGDTATRLRDPGHRAPVRLRQADRHRPQRGDGPRPRRGVEEGVQQGQPDRASSRTRSGFRATASPRGRPGRPARHAAPARARATPRSRTAAPAARRGSRHRSWTYDSPKVVATWRRTRRVDAPRPDARHDARRASTGVPRTGTAAHAFKGFPFTTVLVAGKTGTAEVNDKPPTSLFVGILPADNPQYVVLAVVEEGGFGGCGRGADRAHDHRVAGRNDLPAPVVAAPTATTDGDSVARSARRASLTDRDAARVVAVASPRLALIVAPVIGIARARPADGVLAPTRNTVRGDPLYYVKRQDLRSCSVCSSMAILTAIDYRKLRDLRAGRLRGPDPRLAGGAAPVGSQVEGRAGVVPAAGRLPVPAVGVREVRPDRRRRRLRQQHRGDLDPWRLTVALPRRSSARARACCSPTSAPTMVLAVIVIGCSRSRGCRAAHCIVLLGWLPPASSRS